MGKWVEYKPGGVMAEHSLDEETGELAITRTQEMGALLDRNAELRNTKATDIGIKKGLWHYCSIPVVVQYELLKKGLSICNKHHFAAIYEEINQNYPYLKTTDKVHSMKRSRPKKGATSKPLGPSVIVR